MSNSADETKIAALDPQLAAAGLPTGQTIWVNLGNAIMAAYNAYGNKTTPSLAGYTYVASIWVQETAPDETKRTAPFEPPAPQGLNLQGNTLFGFAAYANDLSHNIIALRGTVTDEEAGYDLYGWGTDTACQLPSNNPTQSYGNVKQDLYDFYTGTDDGIFQSLGASFNKAVGQLAKTNPGKPWIVTAHSLGGALAALGALDAVVSGSYGGSSPTPWLVTFGSLHLGDQSFATAFQTKVPTAFRFANLSDFVPSLVSLTPGTPTDPYVHVGLECTFTWQTWDDWGNHSMANIYLPVVSDYLSVIHLGPRQYPE